MMMMMMMMNEKEGRGVFDFVFENTNTADDVYHIHVQLGIIFLYSSAGGVIHVCGVMIAFHSSPPAARSYQIAHFFNVYVVVVV
jgi:hypothetical protein